MPRVLALDPSLAETGFAVLDIPDERILAHGTIPTQRHLTEPQRLTILGKKILDLIRHHAPTELAIERPFVGHNRSTALILGGVRGVLLYLAETQGLQIHEYTTTQVKNAMTGNPTATKTQVQYMIIRLTGSTPTNHNESDAIAVGLTHLRYQRIPKAIFREPTKQPRRTKAPSR